MRERLRRFLWIWFEKFDFVDVECVCLASFIVSSWTDGGASGNGSESLVLLWNHFACFRWFTVRLFLFPPEGALPPLGLPSGSLCRHPSVLSPPGGEDRRSRVEVLLSRTEHFSDRVSLVFGCFGGFLKAELHSVYFHASRGCCFLKSLDAKRLSAVYFEACLFFFWLCERCSCCCRSRDSPGILRILNRFYRRTRKGELKAQDWPGLFADVFLPFTRLCVLRNVWRRHWWLLLCL